MATAFDAAAYLAQAGPGLLRQMESLFGSAGRQHLVRWQREELAIDGKRFPEGFSSLSAANDLANTVPYMSDQDHWQQQEYWATPAEFVASNGGDCEDFAIAKYAALRAAGIPPARLRMAYVRALTGQRVENHMVLAYYPTPDAEPLILDNLNPLVLPASKRPDLLPVFSFNDDDQRREGIPMVRRWRDLQQRIKAEREL